MMSHKKDKRVVQSEKAIVEAGISTLLLNPSAGMSEIARSAGVGRATLYRHFESREELIRYLAKLCHEEIDIALEPYEHLRGRAAIETIIDVVVPMADRFRFLVNLWSFVEEDEEIKSVESQVVEEMTALFDHAKELGDVNPELPTTWIVTFFDAALMASWMLVDTGQASSCEAAKLVKHSFFQGCGNVR